MAVAFANIFAYFAATWNSIKPGEFDVATYEKFFVKVNLNKMKNSSRGTE